MTKPGLAPGPDYPPASFALPPGATDCHMHLFGRLAQYPCVDARDYTPALADGAAARQVFDIYGIERFVVVQPSVYGTDNTCQLELASAVGLPFRAVAVVDPETSDRGLTRLHDQGVRAIRYTLAHPGALATAHLARSADQARAFGWHLEFLVKPAQLLELMPQLLALSCPFSCDHLAMIDPSLGLDQPAFQALLRLLDSNQAWLKLSGAYRISRRADAYDVVVPYVRKLVELRPDRLVWGSDWPHAGLTEAMPSTTKLLDLLGQAVSDAATRRAILVDNAAVLYGFDAK